MKNDCAFRKKWRGPISISFAVIMILTGIIWYMVLDYNTKQMIVSRDSQESKVSVVMDLENARGERWTSDIRAVDHPTETRRYVGETINSYIVNENNHDIRKWSLKISPKKECYLNGFWGGTLEVHQFREDKEIVETLNHIVMPSEIQNLEYNPYLDSMMIRLLPGDYFIYAPTQEENVDLIKACSNAGVVFNIYYFESLDITEYELTYQNMIRIKDTWIFPVLLILWMIWMMGTLFYHTVLLVNKRILRDLRNSVSSISVMADLYLETYLMDIEHQTVERIKGNPEKNLLALENGRLQEGLIRFVEKDCQESYVEDLMDFLDLSTLKERMKGVSSIAVEYKSNSIGWCSLRMFQLEQSNEIVQYVLAIQDINEERRKLFEVEERMREKEETVLAQTEFMDNIYYALNVLSAQIRINSGTLVSDLGDEDYVILAQSVSTDIEQLHLLNNCVFDLLSLESNHFQLRKEIYTIPEIVQILDKIVKPFYLVKEFAFQMEIDSNLSVQLRGDRERLMQILMVLLIGSIHATEKGFVKLSVFGKKTDKVEEIVFSVRDTGVGYTEEEVLELQELFKGNLLCPHENPSFVYLQIMNQILKKMHSELKLVSVYGSGSEFYFSLEQEIVNE